MAYGTAAAAWVADGAVVGPAARIVYEAAQTLCAEARRLYDGADRAHAPSRPLGPLEDLEEGAVLTAEMRKQVARKIEAYLQAARDVAFVDGQVEALRDLADQAEARCAALGMPRRKS